MFPNLLFYFYNPLSILVIRRYHVVNIEPEEFRIQHSNFALGSG